MTVDEMIRQSQAGDMSAFQTLIESQQNYVYTLAFRFTGNEDDARDILQETFIRIWQHLADFDFRCQITTWMYRIVVNLCLDKLRAAKRQRQNQIDLQQDWLILKSHIPEDNEAIFRQRQMARIVIELAWRLTPKQQAVFILRDLQELDLDHIAQILKISKNSVKSNLTHARKQIRDWIIKLEKGDKNGL